MLLTGATVVARERAPKRAIPEGCSADGLLIVGTALVAVDLWHGGLAPKRPIWATGAGLTFGGVAWAVLRLGEVGGTDQHGDYVVANAAGLTIGSIILATGLIGLGRWLSNEEPVEFPDPTHLAPA